MQFPRSVRSVATVFAVAALASSAEAADPIRWRTDYPSARKEAEEKKLPLLIVVSTADCVYCLKLDASTFADPETAKLIGERFIPLKLDANRDPEFARAMRITVYPTTIIAAPEGKVFAFLAGYLDAAPFRENAGKALALLPVDKKAEPTTTVAAKVPLTAKPSVGFAPEALAAAKEAFQAGRYAEAMEKCEGIISAHPDTPESREAALYVARIKADADKLTAATAELDERTAQSYLALADAWAKQGKPKEAAACYAKAVRASPAGKTAEVAQARLSALKND